MDSQQGTETFSTFTNLRDCFVETLTTSFDKEIIEQYYLSNSVFNKYLDNLNTIDGLESINEDTLQTLYSLLKTFAQNDDLELISDKKCTCSKESKDAPCLCYIDGFGYEKKVHKSLKVELVRLLHAFLLNGKKYQHITMNNPNEMKSNITYFRETSFLWEFIKENDDKKSESAFFNSQLCLAKAQEILFLSQENDELKKLETQNKCNFSILSMLAYGVYKLYDKTEGNKTNDSKRNYYRAMAYHYHLKNIQTRKEVSYTELFDTSVYILKSLAIIEDSEHLPQIQTLLKSYHSDVQNLLRKHGDIQSRDIITYPELKHRILVTPKSSPILTNTLATTDNHIPLYHYFQTIESFKQKETKISQSYQNMVDYNLKNLIQLILNQKCQNIITFNDEVVVNEFRQVEEILNKVLPRKRSCIKMSLDGNPNLAFVKEASSFLKIGYNIDRDNKQVYTKLDKTVLFQKPNVSFAKLLKYLKDDKKYEEVKVQKLIEFLSTVKNYLKILMDLKAPNTKTFSSFVCEQYNEEPKYAQDFDYDGVYEKYIHQEYKDKFDNTLQQIDNFILKQSNDPKCIPSQFNPEDLIDDEIFTFNKQIHLYKTLKNNVTQGLKFYTDIEKASGK